MRRHSVRAAVIAGVVLSACGGASSEEQAPQPQAAVVAADSTIMKPASGVAADPHEGHSMPPESGSAATTDHSRHGSADAGARSGTASHEDHTTRAGAGAGSAAAHADHAVSAGQTGTAGHAGHAAHTDSAHAAHMAARADTTHAAHMAMRADTTHAAHTAVRADTTHAAHAAAARPDSAHAAHAAQPAPAPDAHAAHGVVPDVGSVTSPTQQMAHGMWLRQIGDWTLMGMAQAHPIVSTSPGAEEGTALDATEFYLTQPAVMFNIESPGSRFTLRTTLNFEGVTQADGELSFGGWGEGFLDKRHPHTLLHELMLSVNLWGVAGGDLSISAGKGFAPYGTDDPMARPAVKYPTNHHLSQILERWTVNGAYLNGGWSVEAGLFGGAEPEGPYDLSNIESFGDSWSARVARRFGSGYGPLAETELSASFGRVREVHHEEAEITKLYNAALRHERAYAFGTVYALAEGSMSEPQEDDGYFSLLAETQLRAGPHQPYYRVEYATRPEYEREGIAGTSEFFRYDHDAHAIGATRWLINTVGYGYEATGSPVSVRPFIEVQHNRVAAERGGIEPHDLFGSRNFWGVSAGLRVFLGGDPMRMGSYGILDPMTSMHRAGRMPGAGDHIGHQ